MNAETSNADKREPVSQENKNIVTMSTATDTKPSDSIKKASDKSSSPAIRVTKNLVEKHSNISNGSQGKRNL